MMRCNHTVMPPPTECTCGSHDLQWGHAIVGPQGIVDGRHVISELWVVMYLGCNTCSETLALVPLDEWLAWFKAKTEGSK